MSLRRAVRNQAALAAALARGDNVVAKKGLISSFDPTNYLAKVRLQPEDIETGWLPVVGLGGNGWGLFVGLQNGMQATVLLVEGSVEVGEVVGTTFSTVDRPVTVQPGEIKVVHPSGSELLFTNDGKVALNAASDMNATVGGNLNATVTGDVNVTVQGQFNATIAGKAVLSASEFDLTGAVKVTGTITATGDITAGSISLENHKHSGVQSGGSLTGLPQ